MTLGCGGRCPEPPQSVTNGASCFAVSECALEKVAVWQAARLPPLLRASESNGCSVCEAAATARQLDCLVGSASDERQRNSSCPEGRTVPQGPAVSLFRMRPGKGGSRQLPERHFSEGYREQRLGTVFQALGQRSWDKQAHPVSLFRVKPLEKVAALQAAKAATFAGPACETAVSACALSKGPGSRATASQSLTSLSKATRKQRMRRLSSCGGSQTTASDAFL